MKKIFLVSCLIFLSNLTIAQEGAIKTKNLDNKVIEPTSSVESVGGATLTAAQTEELKKQIEKIKENQKKSQEFLDELDKE